MDRFDREKENYEDVRRIVEEYFEQNNLDEDGNRQSGPWGTDRAVDREAMQNENYGRMTEYYISKKYPGK